MINGVHVLIYSKKAAADKKFFRDVLKCPNVDAGGGWLIFGLPPTELAVHPSPDVISQELYLMCDDLHQFVAEMKKHDIQCGKISSQSWGLHTKLILPSGAKLGVYQPKHERPKPMKAISIIKNNKSVAKTAKKKK